MSSTGQTANGQACPEYWRLYLAWVQADERARDGIRAKMTAHIAVCGCRLGLGGRTPSGVRSEWSPFDEEEIKDEKAGGWDVQS